MITPTCIILKKIHLTPSDRFASYIYFYNHHLKKKQQHQNLIFCKGFFLQTQINKQIVSLHIQKIPKHFCLLNDLINKP